jgi:2-C-methyl-D-erythritol 4-phosphate cytidylyltransferase / 2-C-methyl-D-erythritol 2,4-cyclodiphosphate synthase
VLKTAAVIVAAGRGTRALDAGFGAKQYAELGGRSMLAHSIHSFVEHPRVDLVVVVIHKLDEAAYLATAEPFGEKLRPAVTGGSTRQESVLRGLESLSGQDCDTVLIHDAARPFVSGDIIDGVLDGLATHDGAIASLPCADTLKRAKVGRLVEETVPRTGLWRAQTPQGFRYAAIVKAHRLAASKPDEFTDDASIAEWAGLKVSLTLGSIRNDKITTAEDLQMARRSLAADEVMEPRTGTGFDVHRFAEGDGVTLCGVPIPYHKRLEGHSDADVGLHALTDAILGAIADGDIGQHFPPSDPQWKGAASHVFLRDAARRVAERGGRISNVDITIICEEPKVGPHRETMQRVVADVLGLDDSRVCVKATTSERLGFTGRGEGIAAMASATILLPAAQ